MSAVDAAMSLSGRVVLVTGAGRGIGRQEARYLASLGARVVVNDPGVDPAGMPGEADVAARVVDEITAAGGTAVSNTDDVSDWAGARRMVEKAVDTFGDLHVVINNASTQVSRALVDLTEADFDTVVDVKLKGSLAVSHWAADHWRRRFELGEQADRVIVNTASGSGLLNPLPLASAYAAANAGVGALSIVHTLELARYGVRVNAIAPSMVRTRLTADVPGMASDAPKSYDPLDPIHQAVVAAHLAHPECRITGQIFTVRGSTVIPNRNWSPGRPVATGGAAWRPDELGAALADEALDDQFDKLLAAIGPVYQISDREELNQLISTMLDRSAHEEVG